jgi:hypothetical protein
VKQPKTQRERASILIVKNKNHQIAIFSSANMKAPPTTEKGQSI